MSCNVSCCKFKFIVGEGKAITMLLMAAAHKVPLQSSSEHDLGNQACTFHLCMPLVSVREGALSVGVGAFRWLGNEQQVLVGLGSVTPNQVRVRDRFTVGVPGRTQTKL